MSHASTHTEAPQILLKQPLFDARASTVRISISCRTFIFCVFSACSYNCCLLQFKEHKSAFMKQTTVVRAGGLWSVRCCSFGTAQYSALARTSSKLVSARERTGRMQFGGAKICLCAGLRESARECIAGRTRTETLQPLAPLRKHCLRRSYGATCLH